ncbi:hypothetical protein A3Q56_05383 [Intoshia linei]|uniref:Integrase catalytic domain-containing protein n=1 Tax=Intoshia linei TaxID=1819745 RepID=A0A177AYG8_9BILA|nr:hypothetical protein A3Q56_05383 [Intoshia linei]
MYLEKNVLSLLIITQLKNYNIKNANNLPHQKYRWLEKLESYELDINYRPGSLNYTADLLSRIPSEINNAVNKLEIQSELFDIKTAQFNNSECKQTYNKLINKSPLIKNDKYYNLRKTLIAKNNVIYQVINGVSRLIVPSSMTNTIIKYYHNSILYCHPGLSKLYQMIKKRYNWPYLSRDLREYLNGCNRCNKSKHRNHMHVKLLKPVISSKFNDLWQIDIMGPLPISKNGNKYLINMIDHYSGMLESVAVDNISAETVSKAIYKSIILNYGPPVQIQTDLGKQFKSSIYVPSKNYVTHLVLLNRILRLTGTMKTRRILYNIEFDDWDERLDEITYSFRILPSSRTGISPMERVFGKQDKNSIKIKVNEYIKKYTKSMKRNFDKKLQKSHLKHDSYVPNTPVKSKSHDLYRERPKRKMNLSKRYVDYNTSINIKSNTDTDTLPRRALHIKEHIYPTQLQMIISQADKMFGENFVLKNISDIINANAQ